MEWGSISSIVRVVQNSSLLKWLCLKFDLKLICFSVKCMWRHVNEKELCHLLKRNTFPLPLNLLKSCAALFKMISNLRPCESWTNKIHKQNGFGSFRILLVLKVPFCVWLIAFSGGLHSGKIDALHTSSPRKQSYLFPTYTQRFILYQIGSNYRTLESMLFQRVWGVGSWKSLR